MARSGDGGLLLFLLCFFLGWFGIDKLFKGNVIMFVIKLLLNFIVVGMIWNIVDIIMCLFGKYQVDPRKYF